MCGGREHLGFFGDRRSTFPSPYAADEEDEDEDDCARESCYLFTGCAVMSGMLGQWVASG